MSSTSASFELTSRRRSSRLPLRLAVTISGADAQSNHFEENAETVDVSKYGARVRLSRELKVGSVISVARPDKEGASQFRVVFQTPPDGEGKREVGIEFVGVDSFWGLQFPPDKSQWG